jgi:hypothetical protein
MMHSDRAHRYDFPSISQVRQGAADRRPTFLDSIPDSRVYAGAHKLWQAYQAASSKTLWSNAVDTLNPTNIEAAVHQMGIA